MSYDVIVLGGGPGGYVAAERAGQAGLKTLLIKQRALGGTCLNEGCIPSKVLLNSAKIYHYTTEYGRKFGVVCQGSHVDQPAVVARKEKVIHTLVSGVGAAMKASHVEVVNASGMIRGRGDEVRVRPLSFAEFMQAYDGDVQHGWAEYVMFGGMPLTLSMRSDEQKSLYLKNLFEETYLKDIVSRNGLRRSQELDDLVDVLASSIGALTNPPKIKATFASVLHSGISTNTIMQYIGHLEDAFVIEEARRFDVKGRKYIGSPKKYYFEDMGLRNARLGFCQIEQTHIMENIVYNELRTRGYNVDVGVVDRRGTSEGVPYRKRLEVDFVANLGNRRCYIQSAYQLPTPEKVAQEKASLLEIDDSFQKIVLVRDVVKPVRDEHGILTMSVYDFLLNPDSLTM